jgi:hypothetical protein
MRMLTINPIPLTSDTQVVPHGGVKKSEVLTPFKPVESSTDGTYSSSQTGGYGRFNGIEGLREFSQTKTITINPVHDQYPM